MWLPQRFRRENPCSVWEWDAAGHWLVAEMALYTQATFCMCAGIAFLFDLHRARGRVSWYLAALSVEISHVISLLDECFALHPCRIPYLRNRKAISHARRGSFAQDARKKLAIHASFFSWIFVFARSTRTQLWAAASQARVSDGRKT